MASGIEVVVLLPRTGAASVAGLSQDLSVPYPAPSCSAGWAEYVPSQGLSALDMCFCGATRCVYQQSLPSRTHPHDAHAARGLRLSSRIIPQALQAVSVQLDGVFSQGPSIRYSVSSSCISCSPSWEVSMHRGSWGPLGKEAGPGRAGQGRQVGEEGPQRPPERCERGEGLSWDSWIREEVSVPERWDKMRWTQVYHEAACL